MAVFGKKGIEERLGALERRQSMVEKRLGKLEDRLGLSDLGEGNRAEGRQTEVRLERIEKVMGSSYCDVVAGRGKATRKAGQVARAQQHLGEGHRMNVGARLGSNSAQGPKKGVVSEPKSKVMSANELVPGEISFAEKCKDMAEGTVLMFGSSMVRGVGNRLHDDNHLFGKLDFGGARIEDIKEKVNLIGEKSESHVVFMVGTNNLLNDHPEEICSKYKDLIKAITQQNYRKTSFVGILPRADHWMTKDKEDYIDAKRVAVNMDLAELCSENGIEYVDVEIDKARMLDRKGLHLNYRGQDVVAQQVFKHCQKFLN
jgi:GDSL-like Lipase/Acylhydrolase family